MNDGILARRQRLPNVSHRFYLPINTSGQFRIITAKSLLLVGMVGLEQRMYSDEILQLKTFGHNLGLLPDTQNCVLRMRQECRERFPPQPTQRKPLVSDPGMHHGTCRDACRDRLPAVAWKTSPAFPAHAQPAHLHIWQEAHVQHNPYASARFWFNTLLSWRYLGDFLNAIFNLVLLIAILRSPTDEKAIVLIMPWSRRAIGHYLGSLLLTWFNFNPSMDR